MGLKIAKIQHKNQLAQLHLRRILPLSRPLFPLTSPRLSAFSAKSSNTSSLASTPISPPHSTRKTIPRNALNSYKLYAKTAFPLPKKILFSKLSPTQFQKSVAAKSTTKSSSICIKNKFSPSSPAIIAKTGKTSSPRISKISFPPHAAAKSTTARLSVLLIYAVVSCLTSKTKPPTPRSTITSKP